MDDLGNPSVDPVYTEVYSAAAEAMNFTGTNPSTTAQFLAKTAAKNGFEAGMLYAYTMMRDMRQFEGDAQKLLQWYAEEMEKFLNFEE